MTLQELLDGIKVVCEQNPLVGFVKYGYDIYELNYITIKDYPVMYIMVSGQHTISRDVTAYNIMLFYLDRLLEDDANNMQIFSTAGEMLKNTINHLIDKYFVSDTASLQNFVETERMTDRLAGAYATLQITIANTSICGEL